MILSKLICSHWPLLTPDLKERWSKTPLSVYGCYSHHHRDRTVQNVTEENLNILGNVFDHLRIANGTQCLILIIRRVLCRKQQRNSMRWHIMLIWSRSVIETKWCKSNASGKCEPVLGRLSRKGNIMKSNDFTWQWLVSSRMYAPSGV